MANAGRKPKSHLTSVETDTQKACSVSQRGKEAQLHVLTSPAPNPSLLDSKLTSGTVNGHGCSSENNAKQFKSTANNAEDGCEQVSTGSGQKAESEPAGSKSSKEKIVKYEERNNDVHDRTESEWQKVGKKRKSKKSKTLPSAVQSGKKREDGDPDELRRLCAEEKDLLINRTYHRKLDELLADKDDKNGEKGDRYEHGMDNHVIHNPHLYAHLQMKDIDEAKRIFEHYNPKFRNRHQLILGYIPSSPSMTELAGYRDRETNVIRRALFYRALQKLLRERDG